MITDFVIGAAATVVATLFSHLPGFGSPDIGPTLVTVTGWLSPYTAGIDTLYPLHETFGLLVGVLVLRVAAVAWSSVNFAWRHVPFIGRG